MKRKDRLSRREFIKLSALALGGLALSGGKTERVFAAEDEPLVQDTDSTDFPVNKQLGRICAGQWGTRIPIKSEPFINAPTLDMAWHDDVFEWKREVVATQIDPNKVHQRWVETPEGYIYADDVQRVRHIPQVPLTELPEQADGSRGMWVEITTPYKNIELTKPKSQYQPWISYENVVYPRVYYSMVFWATDVRQNPSTGKTQYLLMQKIGARPDTYWVDAEVCHYITPEEIAPIHPDADNKRILVQMRGHGWHGMQTLTCYEGNEEVFFTTVTTGGFKSGEPITPVTGNFPWRKNIAMHYSEQELFDLGGVGWNYGIHQNGTYIHSTYWHNAFGIMKSNGCINCRPEDAKWIWRWVDPQVPYSEGDLIWSGNEGVTPVTVQLIQ